MNKPYLTPERFDAAVETAARAFGVEQSAIRGRLRQSAASEARLAVYAALYTATRATYGEIAACLGRDHSTVVHGVQQATRKAAGDTVYAQALALVAEAARG